MLAESKSLVTQRIVLIKTGDRQGTGVRIRRDLVLTCFHVVGAAERPLVDGEPCARVIGSDFGCDLALLEVAPADGIEEAEWTEEVRLGVDIIAEGFPGEAFRRIHTRVLATEEDDSGLFQVKFHAEADVGMSGGLAVLEADPFTCVGLVKQTKLAVSTLIGAGKIREFLARHGVKAKMRESADSRQVAEYLRLLREDVGFIDIRALKIEAGGAPNVPIEELYIPLTGAGAREKDEALESALKQQRVVIQGEAGSGKTTFLKRVACELAGGGPFPVPLPVSGFPIYLKVRQLEKYIEECQRKGRVQAPALADHPEWLAHCVAEARGLPKAFVEQKLKRADTVVLLDGLDESPNPAARLETMRLIERTAVYYPSCRFVVTTRPRAGVQLKGFENARIAELTDEARDKFLGDWTRFLYRGQASTAAERTRSGLKAALTARREIERMARNPLMLTALAALYWNKRSLPEERAKLYESILGWLSEQRPERKVNATDCLDWLGAMAWGMQTEAQGRIESIEKQDGAELITFTDRKAALEFLNREEVDSGIVVSDGAAVKFWHLTFQEFLAARHLAREYDNADELLKDGRFRRTEWREVARLYAGLLGKRKAQRLLEAMVEQSRGGSLDARARCVAVVSGIIEDLRPADFTFTDERYTEMLASMAELFRKPAPSIDLDVKVAAAEAMEALQPHPLLRLPADEDYWVKVPGARFVIGRCPVTVHEFAAYVEATGDRPERWEEQLRHPSRPVVYVTWHQAVEYGAWVARSAPGARLPTEREWEFAAAGREGREYPWGNEEPDEERANYEMKVGAPTPVGLFPKGNTPDGASDMAGNVWEWTSSDRSGGKAVRGGAYHVVAVGLRAAYRGSRVDPDVRYGSLGFRLVRE